MDGNRKGEAIPAVTKKRDVFLGFEYVPSEYNLVDLLRSQVRGA